jgi:O-antigen/teichoic acid export membrane protein
VPVYVRYLGYESYGLVGFFATLQVWLTTLDFGLSTTLNRECARFCAGSVGVQAIRDLLASLERMFAAVAIGVGLALIAMATPIANRWLNAQSLGADSVARAIMLMGLVYGVQWMGTLYRAGLSGLQQQLWLSGISCAFATIKAIGSFVVLAFGSATIEAFFVFQLAASALETLTVAMRMHRSLPKPPEVARFSRAALLAVWRFAGGVSLIGLLGTILTQMDKVLLAKLLPLEEFGQFSLLMPIAGALSLLCVPVVNVAFPRLGELVSRGDEAALRADYHRFAQILTVSIAPAAAVLMAFPERLVHLWIGDATAARAIAPALTFWVFGTALNSLTHIPHITQLAVGWTRLSVGVNCISVLASVAFLLALTPAYGMLAAAWIWVGVNVFYLAVAVPLMHRRLLRGELARWLLGDVLAPSCAAAAAVYLCIVAVPSAFDPAGPVALVVLGAVATLAACLSAPAGRAALLWLAAHALVRRSAT